MIDLVQKKLLLSLSLSSLCGNYRYGTLQQLKMQWLDVQRPARVYLETSRGMDYVVVPGARLEAAVNVM